MERRVRALVGLVFATLALSAAPASAGTFVPPTISEVFTNGGEANGAPFQNDFVEVKNTNPFLLLLNGGASLQTASPTGTTWDVTTLTGGIPADGFYLVGLDSNGTEGAALPTPDVTGTSDLQQSGGKIALVQGTGALSGACPSGGLILDLVGWGTADCSEGSGPTLAPLGVFWSLTREDLGCTDSNDNVADFNQTGSPNPRNTAAMTYSCANDPPVFTPIGDQQVDEGVELRFVLEAGDPDGDDVTFTASNLPPGATFNGLALEWTPTCDQAGAYPDVHFEVRDPENETDSEDITITVNEACEMAPTTTTLTVVKKGKKRLLASGAVAPPQPEGEVEVSLLRKRKGNFKRKADTTAELTGGSGYEAKFKRPKRGRCRVVVEFAGDLDAEPSSATDTFRCRKP